jgi:hypothetical protein
MWEPQDPTALPTPEEKRLNDETLQALSSQLLAARQLLHDAEELLRQRQAEVDHIEREIALRRHYAAPVRTLPSEILAGIVMILVMGSDKYHWREIWTFSWTCRAWRNALMANPKIWGARIVVPECRNQLSLVIAARHYARGSHVSLSAQLGAHIHPIMIVAILQYRPKQITALHLSAGEALWNLFSNVKSLPNLRRITFCGDMTREPREDHQPPLNALIPRKNCRTSATKLHEIYLSGMFIGRTPRVFARLRYLHLVLCALPTVEAFVHGISGSSDTLDSLILHRCRWAGLDSGPTSSSSFDFPRLRNLRTYCTSQVKLLRLMRLTALQFFEAGVFAEIWGDSLPKLEWLPPNLSVFGLIFGRGWIAHDLRVDHLQLCLKRSTTLRIYGDWSLPSGIDEFCDIVKQNPLIFGNTITQMEIACHRLTSEQFSEGHLASIKAAFDGIGRDISIGAFVWDPYPLREPPWGTFCNRLLCIFIDHAPRSPGNDTTVRIISISSIILCCLCSIRSHGFHQLSYDLQIILHLSTSRSSSFLFKVLMPFTPVRRDPARFVTGEGTRGTAKALQVSDKKHGWVSPARTRGKVHAAPQRCR